MRELELTKGFVAFVDDEDYERVRYPKWVAKSELRSRTIYAVRGIWINKKRIPQKLHRVILGLTDSKIHIDHINGNGLDNRKNNLRICTVSQNQANVLKSKGTSKYKGVSWVTRDKRWTCRIYVDSHMIHIGYFTDEKLAAIAYNEAALKHFGEFARLNEV